MIGFYRLPLDYLDTWVDQVSAVDVAAVKDAFARRIDPDRMVTVVVGGAR
jgi:zinc protease